jgi:hypothetical protein
MKTIRRTLKKYLEKKLEELVGMADKEEEQKTLDPENKYTDSERRSFS